MAAYVDIHFGVEAMQHLIEADRALAPYIEKYGRVNAKRNPDVFAVLVSCIIGQMLSGKAAATIEGRVIAVCGDFTPANILRSDPVKLREAGLSAAKVDAILNAAKKVSAGELDLDDLQHLTDDEYVGKLSELKGVGRWTAEMVAIFAEGRLDVFSYGDLAIQKAVMKVHGYTSYSKERHERLKKLYSPYGTIASLYYYAINDATTGNPAP